MRRPIQIMSFALAAAAATLVAVGSASAKEPCWQTLIDDWYDGRIDNVYPVSCYRDALEHQPEDVAQYSSLGDDINRALAAAIAGQSTGGSGSQGGGGSSPAVTNSTSTFHGGPKADRGGAGVTASDGRDEGGGPVGQAISSLGPDSAGAVPVPLIVLGALAIVLLALGSAGFVARRLQTRRAAMHPVTKS